MKLLRRLGFALWLALALVAGQHEALLHDLGHASESLAHKQDKPAQTKCEKCFACVPLAGAPNTVLAVPAIDCDTAVFAVLASGSAGAIALAYRSQAPPAVL